MLFARFFAVFAQAKNREVIALSSAAGEYDLVWLTAGYRCYLLASLLHGLLCS